MKSDNRLFDDIARMAGGAAGLMHQMRQQIENEVKTRIDEWAARMDLVPREDLDRLESRINELQEQVNALSTPAAGTIKKTTKKAPVKKAAKKTAKKAPVKSTKTARKSVKKSAKKSTKK